mmetsp:Transcript_18242/g.22372  ORF Transcript_18242/g.22372 Transcript_18242/m.22372 type:complete len:104 (+) Transcript_18242:372-683(+)
MTPFESHSERQSRLEIFFSPVDGARYLASKQSPLQATGGKEVAGARLMLGNTAATFAILAAFSGSSILATLGTDFRTGEANIFPDQLTFEPRGSTETRARGAV